MQAFQGVQTTTTAGHQGAQDLGLVRLGSILPENMTSTSALMAAVPGQDQKWIRGDHTEFISGLRNTEISQNDTLKVVQNRVVNVEGNQGHKMTGSDNTVIHGDRSLHVFAHDDEVYAVHREVHEPFQYEIKGFDGALKVTTLDVVGVDTAFKVLEVGTVGTALNGAIIELEQENLHGVAPTGNPYFNNSGPDQMMQQEREFERKLKQQQQEKH
jgi:hypothetical protein